MPPIVSTSGPVPLSVQSTCERSVGRTSMRCDGPCTRKNEHPVANTADRASARMTHSAAFTDRSRVFDHFPCVHVRYGAIRIVTYVMLDPAGDGRGAGRLVQSG